MSFVTVHPITHIDATITAPPSKSCMQRACALALIANTQVTIHNAGISNDDKASIDIIQKLGAVCSFTNDTTLIVKSNGVNPINNTIDCNESGLSIRMFTPIAALHNKPIIIDGAGSLKNRPMDFFDEIFPLLNVIITSHQGKLPLHIAGPLQAKNIIIDGSLSSQFLTGLLLAFVAAKKNNDVVISVNNLKSKPYIDLTLNMLQQFGVNVTHHNYEQFIIPQHCTFNKNITYTVEGDWSGAAFLLVIGAIKGKIKVNHLNIHSTQADKKIIDAIRQTGALVMHDNNSVTIEKNVDNILKAFSFDATDCPDLFPPLVALASQCKGVSHIKGISRLTHKESNRALTLKAEFEKLGIQIILDDDMMHITGGNIQASASSHSHHDHRIAMAIAVAALECKNGNITIAHADAINKSYPNFYTHLQSIGVNVEAY